MSTSEAVEVILVISRLAMRTASTAIIIAVKVGAIVACFLLLLHCFVKAESNPKYASYVRA